MLEELKYLYEDENIKVKNLDDGERNEIIQEVNNLKSQIADFEFDNEELMFFVFKKVTEPLNEKYDFNNFEIDDFVELINNPHKYNYKNIKSISNAIGDLLIEIITEYLEGLLIQTKQERLRILSLENELEFTRLEKERFKYEKALKKQKKVK